MLANQSDFMAYASALKSNYRKGVHRLETILSNPTMSAEFAANLGGVSVVLGVPISMPDRNSDKLLELLLGSAVADNAVETWLHQFYEFTDWDDLLSDSARCQEMANNPLIWRAAGGSKLAVGKSIATLAGLSCAAYKDIDAVAASQVAMAAVIGNATALNAVVTSSVAAPHSSHCYRRFNNSRHSNLRSCYRRHSNRRGHHGIERSRVADDSRHSNLRGYNGVKRSRVADDSRHSNLMRRKHSSFGVLVCIINIPKSERGITT